MCRFNCIDYYQLSKLMYRRMKARRAEFASPRRNHESTRSNKSWIVEASGQQNKIVATTQSPQEYS